MASRPVKRQRMSSIVPAGTNSVSGLGLFEDVKLRLSQEKMCTNVHAPSACSCRKDSTQCLAGLLPSDGSFRKKGLWSNETEQLVDQVMQDGQNTSQLEMLIRLRQEPSAPVGLRNLGATCYLNGVLQCIYRISRLRQTIFDTVSQDPCLEYTRRLFAEMQGSNAKQADPGLLVNSMGIAHNIHQDVHELYILLLQKIFGAIAAAGNEEASKMLQTLMMGREGSHIQCKSCNQFSANLAHDTEFATILLPLRVTAGEEGTTLESLLAAYQAPELLHGDNQYECEQCKKKCDALKGIHFKRLPPAMSLTLIRMAYNPQTSQRSKSSVPVSIPKLIDMRQHVNLEGQEQLWAGLNLKYELFGILYHKGPSTEHGHFVAHVKDAEGRWWRCDDQDTELLPGGPATCPQDLNSTYNSNGNSKAKGKGSKDASQQEDGGRFTSSNAYMLFYRQTSEEGNDAQDDTVVIPQGLQAHLEDYNAKLRQAHEDLAKRKELAMKKVNERREAVKRTILAAPRASSDDDYRWVPSGWLKLWTDAAGPLPFANLDLACQHKKLSPSQLHEAKRVKTEAYKEMVDGSSLSIEFGPDDICKQCLDAEESLRKAEADYDAERAEVVQTVLAGDEEDLPKGSSYYISRSWFMQWKRSRHSVPITSPTLAIACTHGQLLPDRTLSRRIAIGQKEWDFILKEWREKRETAAAPTPQTQAVQGATQQPPSAPVATPMTVDDANLQLAIQNSLESAGLPSAPNAVGPAFSQLKDTEAKWQLNRSLEQIADINRRYFRPTSHDQVQPASLPQQGPTPPSPPGDKIGNGSAGQAVHSPGGSSSSLGITVDSELQQALDMSLELDEPGTVVDQPAPRNAPVAQESTPPVAQQTPTPVAQEAPVPITQEAPTHATDLSSELSKWTAPLHMEPQPALPIIPEVPPSSPRSVMVGPSTPPGAVLPLPAIPATPIIPPVIEFTVEGSQECEFCSKVLEVGRQGLKDLKEKLARLKSLCPGLLKGTSLIMEPQVEYCLLPSGWLLRFKAYMAQAVSETATPIQLPSLDAALQSLMCECHREQQYLLSTLLAPATRTRGKKWQCDKLKQYTVVNLHEGLNLLQELCPVVEGEQVASFAPMALHPRLITIRLDESSMEPARGTSAKSRATTEESEDASAGKSGQPKEKSTDPNLCQVVTSPESCPNAQQESILPVEFYEPGSAFVDLELFEQSELFTLPGSRRRDRRNTLRSEICIGTSTTLEDILGIFAAEHDIPSETLMAHTYNDGVWTTFTALDRSMTLRGLGIAPSSQIRLMKAPASAAQKLPTPRPPPLKETGFAGSGL